MEHLSRRPIEHQCFGEVVFRLETGWLPRRASAMEPARKKILKLGGVTEVNTFTKLYLCFFGQYDYDACPAIPPEIVLFPNWFWFNIYEISSWSRAILVPLSICYAKKPFKKLPDEMGIEELFVEAVTGRACTCIGRRESFVAKLLPVGGSYGARV